ncbi:MAG: alkaline phosphatase PhoX, partial [Actinomycetota bacterium]
MRLRIVFVGLAGLVTAGIAVPDGVTVSAGSESFVTAQSSMLALGNRADVSITPIITVGDTLDSGFKFEAIPDGIAVDADEQGEADVFVNHETSTVPFPYVAANPTAANGENDFDNSQVSKLELEMEDGVLGVEEGEFVIGSELGYQRFCSNFLGTRKEGFNRPILLTNEEAVEWINTSGTPWPSGQGLAGARQSGVVVAHDVRTGTNTSIWGMGRFNHENSVALPGYNKIVMLSGDDTFASNPAQSQVYSYIARNANGVLKDRGALWAFVSDTAGFDDYYDFVPGSPATVSGHFIQVPRDIATGRLNGTGRDLVAADKGFPAPTAAEFATDAFGIPVDGPQWVLEKWSDANGVFQFVRIEDMAYDKRPGMGNVVYLADSGRGSTGASAAGKSTNGRIWKMVLDPADPTVVQSLSIFLDGDDNPVKTPGEIHQPDNLETTPNSLLVTEDPGSSQQFPFG